MRFTDGFWRIKKGVDVFSAAEISEIKTSGDSVTVHAPYFHISNRGQTLTGPLITVKFSSPMEDVIRVQAYHFKGAAQKGPSFDINCQESPRVAIEEDEGHTVLKSGSLSVEVVKGREWSVNFLSDGRRLTGEGWKSIAFVKGKDGSPYMREQLDLGIGECVYGLGERFTPFVKNGQTVDIWNEDGGTSSEYSYKNIPFYITNRGYGIFVNDPGAVSFEVGSETVSRVQFSVPGEYLEYYVIYGPTMKEVLERYTALTGRPSLPPAWSFGLWLTTSFLTDYDEKIVTGFIEGMKERDLPLHVFHFDCFWMKEYEWCSLEWDDRVFPNPAAMLRRLKDRGLRICVWINPYIAQKSPLFDEGMEKGYLLKQKDGSVYQVDTWQPGMGYVDFTNPEACRWYAGKLSRLVDMGVDCFKTDFGELIPEDAVYFDGSDPVKMHNYYTYLYNKTVFELLESRLGHGKAALFARSATAGGQKFPIHWGGDCTAKFASMAESLRGGLSLGLSGFGFWSHDISGFESTATPDLYKRWVAFGLLSSHSRLHGNQSYRVPWLFDEEAVDVLRFFTRLKCRLMPYLFSIACEASQKGLPVMRAMVLEFTQDPACDQLDRQYMLGGSLLAAPVFDEEGYASYYLPSGTWTDFLTDRTVEGGSWRREKHDYFSLPLMVREGSIIATGGNEQVPDYDFADGVTLNVYTLKDGASASAVVCSAEGVPELSVTVERSAGSIMVRADSKGKAWSLLLHGLVDISGAEGGSYAVEGNNTRIWPVPGASIITIRID